jgi:hypothetical protein
MLIEILLSLFIALIFIAHDRFFWLLEVCIYMDSSDILIVSGNFSLKLLYP